jgi:hypothetical protein
VPDPQALQTESVDSVPAVYPNPAAHLLLLCGSHAPPLVENVPCAHDPAHVASAEVVPGTNGEPAGQLGFE